MSTEKYRQGRGLIKGYHSFIQPDFFLILRCYINIIIL